MNASLTVYRAIAGTQGTYFLLTGVWPLLHMRSFLTVTGPKTDLWLAAIDVIYVTRGVISRIYLADAALEALILMAWAVYAFRLKGQQRK
jgi:hypothetical protein